MSTFVLALDGASPDLIEKWTKGGELPNISSIIENGVFGPLKSTFPPLTGPAWSTFQTGTNPGKHGVFNWLDMSESYKGQVVNASSINVPTLSEIVSSHDGRVGSLSIPLTYPPPEVNGFVVPGFLTPTWSKTKSYPESVFEDVQKIAPNYRFVPPILRRGMSHTDWVENLKDTVAQRSKVARGLYEKYLGQGDELYMIHYFATDLVQHDLWQECTADWDPRLEVFKSVDREIGKLRELAPADSTFILASDHGFGPFHRVFHVNNWLRKEGYLSLKSNPGSRIKSALFRAGFTEENLKGIGEFIFPLVKKLGIVDNAFTDLTNQEVLNSLFLSQKDVDWDNTVAYSRSDVGHVRLNVQGRESAGTVSSSDYQQIREEIMEKLRGLRDPRNGKQLAAWVKPKEEFYSGPLVSLAPDILFNTLDNEIVSMGSAMFMSNEVFSKPDRSGHHRQNGLLAASGPTVKKTNVEASLRDLAPTLLNLMGYPIPEHMDGMVIREIAPVEPSYSQFTSKETPTTSSGEESKERLRNLGYL